MNREPGWREFDKRLDGLLHALAGGLWLHRWRINGRPMAHLVSSDREALLEWGSRHALDSRWLQYKPLKDPRSGERVPCWHWDLLGDRIPPRYDPS